MAWELKFDLEFEFNLEYKVRLGFQSYSESKVHLELTLILEFKYVVGPGVQVELGVQMRRVNFH